MQRTTIDMSMVPSDLSFAESLYALVQNGAPGGKVASALHKRSATWSM
jgi:hypothetical protein